MVNKPGQSLGILTVGAALSMLTLAGVARADDASARIAPAIGNTLVSTHPDGRKAKLWLEKDGRYAAESRAGKRSGGVWKLKGEKLCLTQRQPMSIPFSYCKAVPNEALGKPWRDKAVNGDLVTNEIVPGGPPG